jgi:hypothetical protein
MRFEVPQFIDVEDRIFGPLTWRQFVYVAGAAGAGVILYLSLPFWLFVLLGGPIIALGVGLAFYKVNNRPLAALLEAISSYFRKSRLYLWKREALSVQRQPPRVPIAPVPGSAPTQTPRSVGNNITDLSRKLEVHALTDQQL